MLSLVRACLNFISSALERLERLERNISWLVIVKKGIEQIPSVPTLSVFFGRGSGSVKIVVLYSYTKRSVLGNRILNKKEIPALAHYIGVRLCYTAVEMRVPWLLFVGSWIYNICCSYTCTWFLLWLLILRSNYYLNGFRCTSYDIHAPSGLYSVIVSSTKKKYLHLLIILVFGYAIRQLKCEYLDSCLSDIEWPDY